MKNTTTIEFNDELCTLTTSIADRGWHDKGRHTYMSVSCDFDPEDIYGSGFTCQPEWSIKGENPANDKLWKKYNKFEIAIQKKLIEKAIERKMLPENILNGLSFSRKAGCSCGCSPGWKAKDWVRRDIYISLTAPSKQAEREKQQANNKSQQEEKTLASMVI